MHSKGACGWLHIVAKVLLIIGGLNWGLVAIWDLDLVQLVLGQWPVAADVVYILVALSAIYFLVGLFTCKKHCCGGSCDDK